MKTAILALNPILWGIHADAAINLRGRQYVSEDEPITIGLAISGGAFTSANAGGAIMRGFQQHKINIGGKERPSLEAFDVMSGLSGGNLPLFLYFFARGVTSDELLDADGISDPTKITTQDLETIPEKSMFKSFTTSTVSTMYKCLMHTKLFHTPFWPAFIHAHFLNRYGIHNGTPAFELKKRDGVKGSLQMMLSMIGPASYYPEWNWFVKDKEIQQNFETEMPSRLEPADNDANYQLLRKQVNELAKSTHFLVPGISSDLFITNPKHIMSTEVLSQVLDRNGYQTEIPAILSDEGLEIPFPQSTMNFTPIPNKTDEPLVDFKPFNSTLKDVLTSSGPITADQLLAFPTDMISMAMPSLLQLKLFPKSLFKLAMMPSTINIPTVDGSRAMAFADGGYNDGSGLPALVRKKTRKIILTLCNTPDHFGYDLGFGGNPISFFAIDLGLGSYFGLNNHDFVANVQNQLFDLYSKEGGNHYVTIIENFKSLHEAGEPMITTIKGLHVRDNPFWGVEGGWKLDLTIILMRGVPEKFASLVPRDCVTPPKWKNVTEHGFFSNYEFMFVPNLIHVNIDGPYLPDFGLKTKAARMTQILGSWMIHHSWHGLKGDDGEVKFEGFEAIFDEKINGTITSLS